MRASDREDAAYRRLREAGLNHLSHTLRVLTLHALTERRDDEHPTGWVSGSREWIAERTALTERTVTRHVQGLIDAGELVVWAPHRRRSGRAREYLVVHMATSKQVRRAEKREYERNRNPDSVRPSRGHIRGHPVSPTEPLPALPAETSTVSHSRETVAEQGPVGDTGEIPLVVSTRRSGTKNLGREHRDNSDSERDTSVPSDHLRRSMRSWSDVIEHSIIATSQSHHEGHHRAAVVGLARVLDHITIEQGNAEAVAVIGRAASKARDGYSFATALREELKDALHCWGWNEEQTFAEILADTTIPMTVPQLDHDWDSINLHHREENHA